MDLARDFIGYGANPPNPNWPKKARIAINFVMNYEEGSEPSVQDGEGHTDIGLTEAHGMGQTIDQLREMVELPLRYPELFQRLGVQ